MAQQLSGHQRIICEATNRTTSYHLALFWRPHTLQVHGNWLWELRGFVEFDSHANWKALLHILTTTHRDILIGTKPYWICSLKYTDREAWKEEYGITTVVGEAEKGLPRIPLVSKNRYRIWMCLECVGMTGVQKHFDRLEDKQTIGQRDWRCGCGQLADHL